MEAQKKRTAFAWAMYYEEVNKSHCTELDIYTRQQSIIEEIPLHLVKELEELNKKLKKRIECPICFEVIEDGDLKIPFCGHKYCNSCYNVIDKCAICRKIFNKR